MFVLPSPCPCIVPFFSTCLSQFSIRWRCWVCYQMKRRRTMLGQARTSSCVWRALRRRRSFLALSCVMLRTCATQGALSTPRSVYHTQHNCACQLSWQHNRGEIIWCIGVMLYNNNLSVLTICNWNFFPHRLSSLNTNPSSVQVTTQSFTFTPALKKCKLR